MIVNDIHPDDAEIKHLFGVEHEVIASDPNTVVRVIECGELPGSVTWDGPQTVEPTSDGRHCARVWIQ